MWLVLCGRGRLARAEVLSASRKDTIVAASKTAGESPAATQNQPNYLCREVTRRGGRASVAQGTARGNGAADREP